MHKHRIACKVWAIPGHPGALTNVRENNGFFRAYGKGIKDKELFPVNEAASLKELIEDSDLLILGVPAGDAHEAYVAELRQWGTQLEDKSLLVLAGTAFTVRYLKKLSVEHILESTSSPMASSLDPDKSAVHIKDNKKVMEVSCMRRRDKQGSHHLPYEPLNDLPPKVSSMFNNCFDLEIWAWSPAETTIDGIKTSLHGVPVAYNLEGIADDEDLSALDPSRVHDRGYFYRDWAAGVASHIEDIEEERLKLVKQVGLKRDLPLVSVLNERYDGWNFKTLRELFVAPTCYNEEKLTPHTLEHRFVVEAYIGFRVQAAIGIYFGMATPRTNDCINKFDDLARRRKRKPFGAYGANLEGFTPAELQEFGFARPAHDLFPKQDMANPLALSLPAPRDLRIESFEDIDVYCDRRTLVVAMCSGGLDSTYLIYRLHELGFSNIHVVVVDVGGEIDMKTLEKLATKYEATFQCLPGRKLFIDNVKKAIRAHAMPYDLYPVSSSLSRPVIAGLITDYAKKVGAGLLLHTANLSQNSLPRLNQSIQRNGFSGPFGSPYVKSTISRENKARALVDAGFPNMAGRKLSGDENLWCREFESGPADDPEKFSVPEDVWEWTQDGENHASEKITLGFEAGIPVSVNGEKHSLSDLIPLLNRMVGKFGHGRSVGLEPIITGEKVLELREAPAATIIMNARRHLETAVLHSDALKEKHTLEQLWVEEAMAGRWESEVHQLCEAAITSASAGVSGTMTYDINHSRLLPCSFVAANPLYIRDRDAWEHQAALASGAKLTDLLRLLRSTSSEEAQNATGSEIVRLLTEKC